MLVPSKMADRESVLLEVINTKHKKTGGSLRLMSNNLIWIPYGSDSPKLSCAYSEIKGKIHQRCDFSYDVTCTEKVWAVNIMWLSCVRLKHHLLSKYRLKTSKISLRTLGLTVLTESIKKLLFSFQICL